MAEVARKVESYNLAYQLAWKHISDDEKRKQPNIARLLNSIRRQLSEGATEPVFIASEALAEVGERLDRESDTNFRAR
jgi:hypothetical protein